MLKILEKKSILVIKFHENTVMCIDIVDLYKLHLNILISLNEEWQTEIDIRCNKSYLFEH